MDSFKKKTSSDFCVNLEGQEWWKITWDEQNNPTFFQRMIATKGEEATYPYIEKNIENNIMKVTFTRNMDTVGWKERVILMIDTSNSNCNGELQMNTTRYYFDNFRTVKTFKID